MLAPLTWESYEGGGAEGEAPFVDSAYRFGEVVVGGGTLWSFSISEMSSMVFLKDTVRVTNSEEDSGGVLAERVREGEPGGGAEGAGMATGAVEFRGEGL